MELLNVFLKKNNSEKFDFTLSSLFFLYSVEVGLGPLVFGLVSFLSGDQRLAIISIGFFFLVGLVILTYVKDPKDELK